MKRMAIALIELAKSVVARPVKPPTQFSSKLHWTRFDRPFDQMTEAERRTAVERLADEMLGVIKDAGK
jgi:hypothetical protein